MEGTRRALKRLEHIQRESGAATISEVMRNALMHHEKVREGRKAGKILQWKNPDGTFEDY